ncbi:MAG: CPBP family intramembrane glutamic endopeptidase [Actinomycetota bacterium]
MARLKRSDLKRLEIRNEDKRAEPETVKWTLPDMLYSILFLIAILTGIYFGIARIIIALKIGERINSSNITNLSFSVLYGIQVILMVGVVWFFAIHRRRGRWSDLGFKYYSLIKAMWYSFLALLLIMLINFTYVILMTKIFKISPPSGKIEELISNNNVSYILLLVVVSVIAPICEEIFFRGFLFEGFKKRWGVPAGIIISSLLFSAAHLDLYNFLPLFAIGCVLAYLFHKTKSLLPVILLHAAYNLILILILVSQFIVN